MEVYSINQDGVKFSLIEERGFNGRNRYTILANGRQLRPYFEADNRDVAISRLETEARAYL